MRSSLRGERFMRACGTNSRCLEMVPKIMTKIETRKVKKLTVGTEGGAEGGAEGEEGEEINKLRYLDVIFPCMTNKSYSSFIFYSGLINNMSCVLFLFITVFISS